MMTIHSVLPTKLQKIWSQIHALNQQEKRTLFHALVMEEPVEWSAILEPAPPAKPSVPAELFLWETPPIQNKAQLKAEWWPEEETADDLNEFVRQLRQDDLRRELSKPDPWEA
jgi:hypothetical protein